MMCDDVDDDPRGTYGYDTARAHAKAIVSASHSPFIRDYWTAAKVPIEVDAMVIAIAKKMNIGPKMGQRDVPLSVIRRAVEDVLGAIP